MDRHPIAQLRSGNDTVARLAADRPLPASAGAAGSLPAAAMHAREDPLVENLKSRRQTLGWAVKEVADRCGADAQSLSQWERGNGTPRLDVAQRWAAALGLHLRLVPAESEAGQGLKVDWQARRITVDGTPVRLTPMEWKALERLARAPGEVVTHEALFHHLYGAERGYCAQSTAIRVLITKLRRLLPLRIEAQWGRGYVLGGIEASLPAADEAGEEAAISEPAVAAASDDGIVSDAAVAAAPSPSAGVPVNSKMPRPAAPPPRPAPCRDEELDVIERFLAERGVTRCPDGATIQRSPLPTLVWDKMKRKWVRPSAPSREAAI